MICKSFLGVLLFLMLIILGSCSPFNQRNDRIYVKDYHLDSDKNEGIAISRALSEAKKLGRGVVILEDKQYIVSFKDQNISSNVTLLAGGEKSEITSTVNGSLFKANGQKNIKIKGIKFNGRDNNSVVLQTNTINGLEISDCEIQGMRLLKTELPTGINYSNMTEDFLNKNINIRRNIGVGSDKKLPGAFIDLRYVENVKVLGNNITNYQHGIEWWGGDANPSKNGALNNPRWANNISITKNTIDEIGLGGIWGSMGRNIRITNKNRVTNCGDVGIDVEGTISAKILNNYVKNCKNGCITTFFQNQNITISKNVIESDVDKQYLFKIYNSSNKDNDSITFIDNKLSHVGDGIGYAGGEQVKSIDFLNNSLKNVAINFYSVNYEKIDIKDNNILFNQLYSNEFNAVFVKGLIKNGIATIERNKIVSDVLQPVNSRGVHVILNDYNSSTKAVIRNNEIRGFPTDIEVNSNSANQGITNELVMENNVMANKNFAVPNGKLRVTLDGNRDIDGNTYNPLVK
ncbi:right-handed parallel beta-helix repeat-containing protein [Priestia megaterium]|uniref:right-handed parallel beta-helix repeat-containing protein n=1 Tax=Priestia megaterium TaxID=1404 RepID=UPI002FFEF49C